MFSDSSQTDPPANSSTLYNHVTANLSELDMLMVRSIPPGGNWRDIPLHIAKQSRRLMKLRESGGRTTYYGRLHPDRPSYTINTYFNRPGNGTFIHPTQDRLISFREAARLQSFPDSYIFEGSNASMYKQIGNAVPPLLGKAVGETIPKGKCIDMFSGAGGLSKGLHDAGHDVVLGADKEKHMLSTYQLNHKDASVYQGDFSRDEVLNDFIEYAESILAGETLNLIAGGPPCQGFSLAGKWIENDPRNKLALSMMKVIDALCPEYVLLENVTGLRIKSKGAAMNAIISRLEGMGYDVIWYQLNAEEFGVPQRRRRVFIVASRSGLCPRPPARMFQSFTKNPESSSIMHPPPITVWDAISDLPELSPGDGSHEMEYPLAFHQSHYQSYMRQQITFQQFLRKQTRES